MLSACPRWNLNHMECKSTPVSGFHNSLSKPPHLEEAVEYFELQCNKMWHACPTLGLDVEFLNSCPFWKPIMPFNSQTSICVCRKLTACNHARVCIKYICYGTIDIVTI